MPANRNNSAAEEVLAVLNADSTLIEHFDALETEKRPVSEIKERLQTHTTGYRRRHSSGL